MPLRKHIVSPGQSLVDVALQRVGSAEGVLALMALNPALSFNSYLQAGQQLVYDDQVSTPTTRLWQGRAYVPNLREMQALCSLLAPEYFRFNWSLVPDGSRLRVVSLEMEVTGIIASAVFSEDILIYLDGDLVGQGQGGTATYTDFVSKRLDHGTINVVGLFGFYPGLTYTFKLPFDFITLIDGQVCTGYLLELPITFSGTGLVIPSFDYSLPIIL